MGGVSIPGNEFMGQADAFWLRLIRHYRHFGWIVSRNDDGRFRKREIPKSNFLRMHCFARETSSILWAHPIQIDLSFKSKSRQFSDGLWPLIYFEWIERAPGDPEMLLGCVARAAIDPRMSTEWSEAFWFNYALSNAFPILQFAQNESFDARGNYSTGHCGGHTSNQSIWLLSTRSTHNNCL